MAKVLVVDDEQSLLLLLQQIVEEQGHEALVADNGQQALRILERESLHLVISDVMMPIVDGYQLLRQIKARPEWSRVKVVLISAAPINRKSQPPADAYLSKPYDLSTIEDLLDDMLR